MQEGMVLGHKICHKGIEMDKTKIETIEKLPHSISMKDIQSFLGHMGFHRQYIKYFSKISKPITKLLEKGTPFNFD